MGSRRDRKLKNYLIDKDLQLRIIFINLIHMLIIVIITTAVVLSPLLYDMFVSDDAAIQYHAATTFITLITRLIPAVIILFVLIFFHQVSITHRICGPLVNFNNTFKKISSGDLTRKVILRQGDYLRKECDRINEMIDGLARILRRVRSNHDKLISELEELMVRVEDLNTRKKIEKALEIVKGEAKFVKRDLSVFNLGSDMNTPRAHDQDKS